MSPLGTSPHAPHGGHPPHAQRASEMLEDLLHAFPGEAAVSMQDILDKLKNRAFGLLLLLLALPNCIPNIPGISTVFGLLLLAPALQLIFGAAKPWLPKRIMRMTIQATHLRTAINGSLPVLKRIEKLVQPRWEGLYTRPFQIWYGIQITILAAILILPIPFGNWPPGMAVAALALGILQRDGVAAIVSFGFFIASLIIAPLGIGMGLAALAWLGKEVAGLMAGFFGLFG
jgi:hypothetical protein